MRHLSYVLCASIAACGYSALALATPPPLAFTLDLLAPCTPAACGTAVHATDIGLNILASSFTYAPGTGNSFVATMDINAPVACDEIASGGALGATSPLRLAPTFTNSAPGGLLEFNGGGASIVDLSAITYDGSTPSGVAASYSNYGATPPPQVVCYQINPVSGGPVVYAAGPYGIFSSNFESNHPPGEPWLSVQTVFSPQASAGKSIATSSTHSNAQINGVTPTDAMGYVVQIHNAATAVGWHVDLGYDYTLFDPVNNGGVPVQWCVLGSGVPQPGVLSGSASCSPAGTTHTIASGDIQAGSNSIYIYVENRGSSAAGTSWSSITSGQYPAVAAVFPPFGTYPQRFDDKVAVASANNLPTLNIGSIVCHNDTTSTSCTISDQDGNPVPAQVTYHNTITGGGAATMDPLAYFVDPTAGSTLPGNIAADALAVSNVSCSDPNSILASGATFPASTGAQGAVALGFSFAPSGSPDFPYVAGTATCTATFATTGYSPLLSTTQSFTITMQQAAVGSVAVVAPVTLATPNGGLTFNLTVANTGNAALANVGVTDNQAGANFTVTSWTCAGNGASCPAASGSAGLSHTIALLPVGSSLTYAISGSVGANPNPSYQITNSASIAVPNGSCSGGTCVSSASVTTVPIIAVSMQESEPTYHTSDAVTYTITLANNGGTPANGLSLTDLVPSGVTFDSWTCAAVGTNSTCPNASGSGSIGESLIAIDASGNVSYTINGTVTSTGGTITNMATAGLGGAAVCAAGACSASATMTLGP